MQQNEEPDVPNVPVMPASVTFETKVPEYGWWILRAKVKEEKFENNRVVAWPENSDKKRRSFEFEIAAAMFSTLFRIYIPTSTARLMVLSTAIGR